MQRSESIKELATALSKAQLEIENASKNAANPHFRSKYADLAEVLNTVRPVFSKHGLSVIQFPSYENCVASVETVLAHESGEFVSNVSSCRVTKDDAQGVGSATTYLRRYSLAAVAGIAQEDDDGAAQVAPPKPQKETEPNKELSDGILIALQEAALNGQVALQQVFKSLDATIEKKLVWEKHSKSLKEAAKAADLAGQA